MSNVRRDLVGGLWGLTAGMGAILPSTVCAGGACASCFACVGVGGVAVSIAAARFVFGRRTRRSDGGPPESANRDAIAATIPGEGGERS